MNGIDVTERSGLPRQAHDFGDVVDRSYSVRGIADCDQSRASANLPRQILHVERAIVFVELHGADRDAFFFQRLPRGEVRVVIEQREHDFVAGTEFASKGAAQGESQRGHVRAEDDLVGIAIEKVGHRRPRFRDHAVGVATGEVGAARVGVVARQIIRDGVNHALRHLRATGAIQKDRGTAIDGLCECRELGADPIQVERGGGRWRSGSFRDGHSEHSNPDCKNLYRGGQSRPQGKAPARWMPRQAFATRAGPVLPGCGGKIFFTPRFLKSPSNGKMGLSSDLGISC